MKKRSLFILFLLVAVGFVSSAQDVETFCCKNVDYSLVTRDLNVALKTPDKITMLDLSMQTPKLTEVPVEVAQLSNLKYLDLSFNRISTFPEEFKKLSNLECLDLSGNNYLQKLPSFLNDMPNLKVIKIKDLYWNTKMQHKIMKQFPHIKFIF